MKKINRLECDSRKWHWKKTGNSILLHHVQSTIKYGGGSVVTVHPKKILEIYINLKINQRQNNNLFSEEN